MLKDGLHVQIYPHIQLHNANTQRQKLLINDLMNKLKQQLLYINVISKMRNMLFPEIAVCYFFDDFKISLFL